MTRLTVVALALPLLSCGERIQPVPPPVARAPEESPSGVDASAGFPEGTLSPAQQTAPLDAWIVWARDDEGAARSFWVERDARGRLEILANDGILVGVDGELFHWAVYEEELETTVACGELNRPPVGGTGVRVLLESVDDDRSLELITPDREAARDASDWNEVVRLEASAGPYLFVRRSAWAYHCGAHGSSSHRFVVLDARTGGSATIDVDPGDDDRQRAWTELESQDVFATGPGELTPTLYRPVFGADGVAMEYQWTAETCYACSDGRWDSYTVSARVRSRNVPDAIRRVLDVPGEALDWIRDRFEPAEIGGVSRVAAEQRQAFEQLVIPGC